jgi:succinate-semialdehyde dehydrogenase/glutarate-semialdehyde dehydrogenase
MDSINPATEEIMKSFAPHTKEQIAQALVQASETQRRWRRVSFEDRSRLMKKAAELLRQNKAMLAGIITSEMGKPIVEAEAEVEKCAWNCDYYANHAASFLKDEPRDSNATESYIQYPPLGVILAIMPWNFPFWQVFRFAAPALMAGNTCILKHASNVPQCSLAIEEIFRSADFPEGAFRSLLVPGSATVELIEAPQIAAITLTGSEGAGSAAASAAGRMLKKTVLELGGSDPFIVLEDADLDAAAKVGVRARYQNAGQSCIAAKRFIIVESVWQRFQDRFVEEVRGLKIGDPTERDTRIGPLARRDLLDDLDRQVRESVARGARVLLGGRRRGTRGYYFDPTVLSEVALDSPGACEETFGPVAALIKVRNADEALQVANDCPYGLGANLWTADLARGRAMARDIEAGQVFINGMTLSDPRLPFGGVKLSGYGRELSEFGIREFVNIQTVWIGPART